MKVCTTCGREWDTVDNVCPDDGATLSVVVGRSSGRTSGPAAAISNSSGQRQALQPEPEPEALLDEVDRDELAVGLRVGEYQIERKIGVGGMGVVYGARHPVIGKRAAIKVLNARLSVDREAVSRFVLEAQAVNQIGHANIVDIFSFGTLPDGRSYFVMEWLQGETLGERIERGPLALRETTAILIALCRALEAAHAAGVIHRDLKPDNVFLATDDEGWRVKLLDFGIAKLSVSNPSISRTATGMVVGTPLFMAPEQAKGEPVDGRTDVYALGLLAYTMVVGTSLFESESSAIEVLAAHISKPPPPPRSVVAEVPEALDKLILEMVDKRPGFRPSLVDIRQQLTAITGPPTGPVSVPRVTVRAPSDVISAVHVAGKAPTEAFAAPVSPTSTSDALAALAPRRSRAPLMIGIVLALGLGAGAIAVMGGHGDAKSPPPPPAPAVAAAAAPVAPPDAAVAVAAVAADAAVAPPPARATAELAVEPAAARVTIDGVDTAITGGHATLTLAPGDHVAVASLGARSIKKAFTVTLDQRATVALVVPAAAAPVGNGGARHPPITVTKPGPKPPGVDVDGVHDPFH